MLYYVLFYIRYPTLDILCYIVYIICQFILKLLYSIMYDRLVFFFSSLLVYSVALYSIVLCCAMSCCIVTFVMLQFISLYYTNPKYPNPAQAG